MQKKLIINEKKFAEDLISSAILPEDVSANTAIKYLTRYYCEYGNMDLQEITDTVFNKMKQYKLTVVAYQEYKANELIKRIHSAIGKGKINKLRTYDSIPLYKSEYEKIMECETDREKKVLFTIYILARYTGRYGWVYNSESEIYKLANVSSTTKNKVDVFASLLNKGMIKDTKKVNDLKIGVDLSDSNDEVILEVNDLKNVGNQFIAFIKDDYIMCKECGKLVKIKSKYDGSTQYCEKCAYKITKENWVNASKKYRET